MSFNPGEHTYFSNQEEHSGSIWSCVVFDFIPFLIFLFDQLEKISRCTLINLESTDVVGKCLWNYLHSQTYYMKKTAKKTGFYQKNTVFFSF